MKKIIALFLVLSLLSFPQLGAVVVSAEGREAGIPAQPAAALTDTADAGEAVPELEAAEARPAGYSGPEASDPSLEPAAVRGAEDTADVISYTIEDGVLRVTGSGAMPDYEYGKASWKASALAAASRRLRTVCLKSAAVCRKSNSGPASTLSERSASPTAACGSWCSRRRSRKCKTAPSPSAAGWSGRSSTAIL